jgi:hypothetical protein
MPVSLTFRYGDSLVKSNSSNPSPSSALPDLVSHSENVRKSIKSPLKNIFGTDLYIDGSFDSSEELSQSYSSDELLNATEYVSKDIQKRYFHFYRYTYLLD